MFNEQKHLGGVTSRIHVPFFFVGFALLQLVGLSLIGANAKGAVFVGAISFSAGLLAIWFSKESLMLKVLITMPIGAIVAAMLSAAFS